VEYDILKDKLIPIDFGSVFYNEEFGGMVNGYILKIRIYLYSLHLIK